MFAWLPKAMHSEYAKLFRTMQSKRCIFARNCCVVTKWRCILNMSSYFGLCRVNFAYLHQILSGYQRPCIRNVECTRNVLGMCTECTRNALGMHQERTRNVLGMYKECTTNALCTNQECIRNALGMYEEYIRNAQGMR